MQQVFSFEETSVGMRSLVVVSSFNEEEMNPIMLFTPTWFTYAFVNIGGHYGSYKVEN